MVILVFIVMGLMLGIMIELHSHYEWTMQKAALEAYLKLKRRKTKSPRS